MKKITLLTKIIFHICNTGLIFLYLYPGSIFGWIIYGDFSQQPEITRDFIISSNHLYAFILLSTIGLWTYVNDKKFNFVVKYLFLLSIILELFHIFIPERNFQFGDLFGNILGVIIPFVLYKTWKKI